jgi:hypothetical protein
MNVYDVLGKSAVYYPFMTALGSLLNAFMKKIIGLCRHHECGIVNLACA